MAFRTNKQRRYVMSQLKKGTMHEREHSLTYRKYAKKGTSNKEFSESIAKDHLSEDKDYYKKLDKCDL